MPLSDPAKPGIMNKQLTAGRVGVLLIALVFLATACVKDNCKGKRTYTFYRPVYKAKTAVIQDIKSQAPREIENPGKIYILGKYIFLNDIDKGVHVIDNTNPAQPKQVSFIEIPGNMDIAVKGNTLYADFYGDLVVLDISNPAQVKAGKIIENIFPERNWGTGFSPAGESQIVVNWIKTDTTVEEHCEEPDPFFNFRSDVFFQAANSKASASVSPVGAGGSMARFTIKNDYLYTVDRHSLRCIAIGNPMDPVLKNEIYAGWDIETIYPFKNTLFLGSMGGMFIFDITNPEAPVQKSTFVHARACDPVIADDKYAYVTLKAGTNCGPAANELQVINVEDLSSPSLVATYAMTGPAGLSKDNDLLFICDGTAGLKTYQASDVLNLKLLNTISGPETYDVITFNKIALVVAKDGLHQYDYSNPADIRLLSKIAAKRN